MFGKPDEAPLPQLFAALILRRMLVDRPVDHVDHVDQRSSASILNSFATFAFCVR